MAKAIDPALAQRLRRESERTKKDAYPPGVTGPRPNRRKVYSVRLSAKKPKSKQSPPPDTYPTTLVRSWTLERLDQERPA